VKLIIACTPAGGIGLDNKLPWSKIEGDLPRFKKLTTDQVIVMGRNTWLSLPKKPLPSRLNFVVTSQQLELPPGAVAIKDLSHFKHFKNAWLIGGASLVNSSWDYIDEIHLSRTHIQYDCDCFVDLVYLENNYTRVHIEHHKDHSYEVWKRKNGTVSQFT